MKTRIMTAVVLWAVSWVPTAIGAPCAGSSYPAAGLDAFPSSVTLGLDTDPGCGAPSPLSAQGSTTVKRSDPSDPGDGRCTIATEMVFMSVATADNVGVREATGGSDPFDAGDPPCAVGGAAADGGPGCSPGQLRAQSAGIDVPADSQLDTFVEIDLPGQTVFNRDPIVMQAVVSAVPALGTYTMVGSCIPLYDVADPFGAPVLYVSTISHKAGCGNGILDPGEDCDGGACCTAECTFAPAATPCRSSGNQCDAEETCDGVSADCPSDGPAADGTPCVDDNACTDLDTCQSGVCTSGPAVTDGTSCDDGNTCTAADTCQAGICTAGPPVTDGTSCDDHHLCTGPDTCTAGTCGGPVIPDCGPSAPFGGDDTGFVPPDKAAAKCEDGVTKNVGALTTALIKCNVKDSDYAFKGKPFDSGLCQSTAAGKFDAKVDPLVCDPCVAKSFIRDLTVTLVNLNGGLVFCDDTSGTPLDLPGTGFVPPDKIIAKCEDGTAKNAGKLAVAIAKCHIKVADSSLKDRFFDEEGCEAKAKLKYDTTAARLTACPPCLNQNGLRDLVETLLDANNGLAYCASPSGAFVD